MGRVLILRVVGTQPIFLRFKTIIIIAEAAADHNSQLSSAGLAFVPD